MSEPKRIQRKRTKGWRMPEGAVYVGCGSKWGNPFRVYRAPNWPRWGGPAPWLVNCPDGSTFVPVGDRVIVGRAVAEAHHKSLATKAAVEMFARDVAPTLDLGGIRGMDLACWCPLDQPCHADVLLEIANATTAARAELHPDAEVAAGTTEEDESA